MQVGRAISSAECDPAIESNDSLAGLPAATGLAQSSLSKTYLYTSGFFKNEIYLGGNTNPQETRGAAANSDKFLEVEEFFAEGVFVGLLSGLGLIANLVFPVGCVFPLVNFGYGVIGGGGQGFFLRMMATHSSTAVL